MRGQLQFLCRCQCGCERIVASSSLRSGGSRSCGCLTREATGRRSRTHGESRSPTYRTWQNMVERCRNPSASNYHRYGGRGISVCDAWAASFPAFVRDMGSKPGHQYSLDRIDNEMPYQPGNCRWATRKEQARNTSMTTLITLNGETRALSDWCDLHKIKPNTFRSRLRYGWNVEKSLTEPLRSRA